MYFSPKNSLRESKWQKVRTRLKNAIFKLVKANSGGYDRRELFQAMGAKGGTYVVFEHFILEMVLRNELSLMPDEKIILGPRTLSEMKKKREKAGIKRAVLKQVRANPNTMNINGLIHIICHKSKVSRVSEILARKIIWAMIDRGELILIQNVNLDLGPKAPKLRKK